MKRMYAIILFLGLMVPVCNAGAQDENMDPKTRNSYSLGYEFGANILRQEVEIDKDVLFSALRDALDGNPPALQQTELHATLLDLRKQVLRKQEVQSKAVAAKNLEEGKSFLESNAKQKGVKTLPSGLQYKVLQDGNGPVPKTTDKVTVQYRGTLVNGTEFDSSYSRGKPESFQVDSVIKGWTEALRMMKTGSKWQVFVPAGLAYGERRFGYIPANSTLIFELELLSIAPTDNKAKPAKSATKAKAKPSA